jgi:DNA polymerase IV
MVVSVLNKQQANVALVNESYPSECLQFRSVLNHSQLRFRIDGFPQNKPLEKSPGEELPPESLTLKPSRREQNKSPERTQSSHGDLIPKDDTEKVAAKPVTEAITVHTNKGNWVRDALDDIIDEAKATSHLVSPCICSRKLKQLIIMDSPWI